MSILMNYDLTISKINQILDEVNKDRNTIFNAMKTPHEEDKINKIRESKLSALESVSRALLKYKNILTKEAKRED